MTKLILENEFGIYTCELKTDEATMGELLDMFKGVVVSAQYSLSLFETEIVNAAHVIEQVTVEENNLDEE